VPRNFFAHTSSSGGTMPSAGVGGLIIDERHTGIGRHFGHIEKPNLDADISDLRRHLR